MSEDHLYLLFCYLIFGLTLAVLVFRSKKRLKTLSLHLIIALLYSGVGMYNLTFNSTGGSGLVWLVYWMFALGLHWILCLATIILTFTKTNQNREA